MMAKKKPTRLETRLNKTHKKRKTAVKKYRGRKPTLTPTKQARIVKALEKDAFEYQAAAYAGISVSTYQSWKARGWAAREALEADEKIDQSEVMYLKFLEAVENAIASSAVDNLDTIKGAAKAAWQPSAWLLERRHGFIQKQATEHSGQIDHGLIILPQKGTNGSSTNGKLQGPEGRVAIPAKTNGSTAKD